MQLACKLLILPCQTLIEEICCWCRRRRRGSENMPRPGLAAQCCHIWHQGLLVLQSTFSHEFTDLIEVPYPKETLFVQLLVAICWTPSCMDVEERHLNLSTFYQGDITHKKYKESRTFYMGF
jgi:hypothetical protein